MPLTGTLRDLSLVDLVQLQCSERKHAQILLISGNSEGRLIFADGELIFASAAGLTGKEAVRELLMWDDVEFRVDHEPIAAEPNVNSPWPALLLEATRQVDEARAERDLRLESSLRSLRGTLGLRAVVSVNGSGLVRAAATEGQASQDAALISFVAGRLEAIGAALNCGAFKEVLLSAPTEKVWITKQDASYLACWLDGRASLGPLAARIQPLLSCGTAVGGGQTIDEDGSSSSSGRP